ncbi:MAG: ABC transporter ATP-binding protein [Firmicutes bacterium]|nr:ABC transporter ATP-binding protein [Bacillota bacterium]
MILKVENLVKEYGKDMYLTKALDNLSFSVNDGEFVAIVGTSGSGKSTLLHLIGGVDKPTSGNIIVRGENIYNMNDEQLSKHRRKNVGLIYQFYNLIPILNVEENIELPVLLDKGKVDEKFKKELVSILKLDEYLNYLPNQLSGGTQQRVAIARALINYPALVLADEPTGNLDSKNSEEIINLLKLLNTKYKQTVIMVTHDLNIANQAERIITVSDGKIISDIKNNARGVKYEDSE